MTRSGVPPIVTPSQYTMGVFADQFSVALPARASRPASSALQSATSHGLRNATGTACPVAQALVVTRPGVPVTAVDQGPVLVPLTPRTCTWYSEPPTSLLMEYCRLPPALAVHTSSNGVQLESTVPSTTAWI